MDPKFINILCCPKNVGGLTLENATFSKNGMIKDGLLRSTVDKNLTYPIINGIPRFIGEESYSSNFGFEWKKWPRIQFESENKGKPMEGRTRKMFDSITSFTSEKIKDKYVVEFGCGAGRFLDIVREKGGLAIGIDMSMAVEVARANFKDDHDVFIVQGDILNPPFKKDVFDYGFSIGVFHHTPNPKMAVLKMTNSVKPGGEIAIRVYPKKSLYDYTSVYIFRNVNIFISKIFGKSIMRKPALLYSYFSAYLLYPFLELVRKIPVLGYYTARCVEKFVLVNVQLPDVNWRVLDVFDAITPEIASTHTAKEVTDWLTSAKLSNIKQTTNGNSFAGVKS